MNRDYASYIAEENRRGAPLTPPSSSGGGSPAANRSPNDPTRDQSPATTATSSRANSSAGNSAAAAPASAHLKPKQQQQQLPFQPTVRTTAVARSSGLFDVISGVTNAKFHAVARYQPQPRQQEQKQGAMASVQQQVSSHVQDLNKLRKKPDKDRSCGVIMTRCGTILLVDANGLIVKVLNKQNIKKIDYDPNYAVCKIDEIVSNKPTAKKKSNGKQASSSSVEPSATENHMELHFVDVVAKERIYVAPTAPITASSPSGKDQQQQKQSSSSPLSGTTVHNSAREARKAFMAQERLGAADGFLEAVRDIVPAERITVQKLETGRISADQKTDWISERLASRPKGAQLSPRMQHHTQGVKRYNNNNGGTSSSPSPRRMEIEDEDGDILVVEMPQKVDSEAQVELIVADDDDDDNEEEGGGSARRKVRGAGGAVAESITQTEESGDSRLAMRRQVEEQAAHERTERLRKRRDLLLEGDTLVLSSGDGNAGFEQGQEQAVIHESEMDRFATVKPRDESKVAFSTQVQYSEDLALMSALSPAKETEAATTTARRRGATPVRRTRSKDRSTSSKSPTRAQNHEKSSVTAQEEQEEGDKVGDSHEKSKEDETNNNKEKSSTAEAEKTGVDIYQNDEDSQDDDDDENVDQFDRLHNEWKRLKRHRERNARKAQRQREEKELEGLTFAPAAYAGSSTRADYNNWGEFLADQQQWQERRRKKQKEKELKAAKEQDEAQEGRYQSAVRLTPRSAQIVKAMKETRRYHSPSSRWTQQHAMEQRRARADGKKNTSRRRGVVAVGDENGHESDDEEWGSSSFMPRVSKLAHKVRSYSAGQSHRNETRRLLSGKETEASTKNDNVDDDDDGEFNGAEFDELVGVALSPQLQGDEEDSTSLMHLLSSGNMSPTFPTANNKNKNMNMNKEKEKDEKGNGSSPKWTSAAVFDKLHQDAAERRTARHIFDEAEREHERRELFRPRTNTAAYYSTLVASAAIANQCGLTADDDEDEGAGGGGATIAASMMANLVLPRTPRETVDSLLEKGKEYSQRRSKLSAAQQYPFKPRTNPKSRQIVADFANRPPKEEAVEEAALEMRQDLRKTTSNLAATTTTTQENEEEKPNAVFDVDTFWSRVLRHEELRAQRIEGKRIQCLHREMSDCTFRPFVTSHSSDIANVPAAQQSVQRLRQRGLLSEDGNSSSYSSSVSPLRLRQDERTQTKRNGSKRRSNSAGVTTTQRRSGAQKTSTTTATRSTTPHSFSSKGTGTAARRRQTASARTTASQPSVTVPPLNLHKDPNLRSPRQQADEEGGDSEFVTNLKKELDDVIDFWKSVE